MSSTAKRRDHAQSNALRAVFALIVPPLLALLLSFLAAGMGGLALDGQAQTAFVMTVVAVTSLLLGLRWYGLAGMGFRGGRALTAGIGFAALIWIVFLALRFIFVAISPAALESRPPHAGRTFMYLLLFEALATQIWTYGLVFRAVSDWRGPLTGAIVSGISFGLVGILLFQESMANTVSSAIYFVTWGIVYGIIRLRTGSIGGTVVGQAAQTFTSWVVLTPYPDPNIGQLNNLYLAATVAYMIIAWRLWPKQKSDYRV
ncbi:MAG: type II CAAX prenyl endopeptidase Rce1 family protein [Candidatus Promineifilaceae bacterium]